MQQLSSALGSQDFFLDPNQLFRQIFKKALFTVYLYGTEKSSFDMKNGTKGFSFNLNLVL